MLHSHPTTRSRLHRTLAGAALFAVVPAVSHAALSYRWDGPAEGGLWGDAANWFEFAGTVEGTDYGFPAIRSAAYLQNTEVDRNIIFNGATYDGANLDWVRDTYITQTSAAVNQLSMMKNFTFGNGLTLSATNGGTAKLLISNAEVQAATPGSILVAVALGHAGDPLRYLTVGSGGILEMAGTSGDSNQTTRISRGDVVIESGGQFLLQDGLKGGTDNSVSYNLSGNLSINDGTLVFGAPVTSNPNNYTLLGDVRLALGGDFTAHNAQIINMDTSRQRMLWLSGATNVISGNTILDDNIAIILGRAEAQSLRSSIGLNNVHLRGGSTTEVTLEVAEIAGGNIGQIQMTAGSDRTKTLKLDSNLTTRSGYSTGLTATNTDGTSGVVTYKIDTNGYTYDMSAATNRWDANRANTNITRAVWDITGGGTMIVRAVNFSGTGVAASLGEDTTLVIKGGANNNLNRLDSPEGGEIAASSTIIYDGEDGSLAEIASNRQIGKLIVRNGTLRQATYGDGSAWNFYAAGGIEIDAGGHLQMDGNRVIYAQDIKFVVDNALRYGSMAANVSYYLSNVDLVFAFNSTAMFGTYDFFSGTHLSGTANSVVIGGIYDLALSYDTLSELWTGSVGNVGFSFSQDTGLLTVVPEPAVLAVLMGGAAAGVLALRRRRRV